MQEERDKDVLLEVDGLVKHFGKNEVLNGISTKIMRGEKVAVIGPSGSGKSTFLRCLNLLEQPSGGNIYFEGESILETKSINTFRRKMWMVFQHFNLFNNLTVLENIMFAPVKLAKVDLRKQKAARRKLKIRQFFGKDRDKHIEIETNTAQIEKEAKDRALALLTRIGLADKASAYPSTL